ncbi:MAG: NAD(+) synthase [Patescibacteria group bacterium]|nr:NAD(+) synthase [Patescibacteria group bacterium]
MKDFSASVEAERITKFLKKTYQKQGFDKAVIAVSGGIDSAVSLTLLTKALGSEKIIPLFLPFGEQSTTDARLICQFNQILEENWFEHNIGSMVEAFAKELKMDLFCLNQKESGKEKNRLGNIMARCRMIVVYDTAKKHEALVCGTKNQSERKLGYFTRYGDGASDIEPIVHLLKKEVRVLAEYLAIPEKFIEKAPSAGLWQGQTDEDELGFSYDEIDQVILAEELGKDLTKLNLDQEVMNKIKTRIKANNYKEKVPYELNPES